MTTQPQNATPANEIDTDRLGNEAVATGASMGTARLGGLEGVGTLQVVRGNELEVVEIRGTWRSTDDDASDDGVLARLCEAAASGGTVQYQGPLVDPDGDRDRATVDVEFTSTNRYGFMPADDSKGETEGPSRRIFNFRPVGGEASLHR